MSAGAYNVDLLKVSLDVPLRGRFTDAQKQLLVVTTPIRALEKGKTYSSIDGHRYLKAELLQLKTNSLGMLPGYVVICKSGDLSQAVEMIHAALKAHLSKVMAYYQAASSAVENPLLVKTKEEYMDDLMGRGKSEPDD